MVRVDECQQAAPLPLAPYGGTAAPLKTLLPDLSIPIPCLFRCSIAVMLINELIVSGLQIDWSAHLPQLLHVAMLGRVYRFDKSHDLFEYICFRYGS